MKRGSVGVVMLGVALLSSFPARAETDPVKTDYVASIVTVLRIHVESMRRLSDHEFRYSDNMVRHAIALQRTFGLLGPMEWHVASSIELSREKDPKRPLDEETFDILTKKNRLALKHLDVAAHRWMRDGRRDLLTGALDRLIKTCDDCHSRLPEGSVPDVWGTLTAE